MVADKNKVLDNSLDLIVIFHKFKGCDGMFILKHLYDNR